VASLGLVDLVVLVDLVLVLVAMRENSISIDRVVLPGVNSLEPAAKRRGHLCGHVDLCVIWRLIENWKGFADFCRTDSISVWV
jgi:hypothetical protein